MMMFLLSLPPLVYAAWFILAIVIALFGRRRKLGPWGYFFASILLTPVIGLLLLMASDPKPRAR